MSKKSSKMSEVEKADYLIKCDASICKLIDTVNFTLSVPWSFISPAMWYIIREMLLKHEFKTTLDVLQIPKESSDYSQEHLRQWRLQVRRLDGIAERYLKTLYVN